MVPGLGLVGHGLQESIDINAVVPTKPPIARIQQISIELGPHLTRQTIVSAAPKPTSRRSHSNRRALVTSKRPRSSLLLGAWVDPPRGKKVTPAACGPSLGHLVVNGVSPAIGGPKLTAFRIASPERAYPPC